MGEPNERVCAGVVGRAVRNRRVIAGLFAEEVVS